MPYRWSNSNLSDFQKTILPGAPVPDRDGAAELRRKTALAQVRRQPADGEGIEDQQDERHASPDADPAVGRHELPGARRRPGGRKVRAA